MQWTAQGRVYKGMIGLGLSVLLTSTPGWSASVTGPSYSQAPLGPLWTTTAVPKGVSIAEDSLWAGLLLNFAMQRDPELAKVTQKQNNLNRFVYGNVMALGLLNAGQSVPFLVAPTQTLGSRRVMGVIGSGMLLFGTGLQGFLENRYNRRTAQRINLLKAQVGAVIEQLYQGALPSQVKAQLNELVGSQASEEFLSLWQTTHPYLGGNLPLALPVDIDTGDLINH